MKKNRFISFIVWIVLSAVICSCQDDSPQAVVERASEEYKSEYGSDIIMNIEKEIFRGKKIYRLTGWTEREERMFTEINPDEWILIFCADKNHQLIKGTAYRPMDSIIKYEKVKCFLDLNKTNE